MKKLNLLRIVALSALLAGVFIFAPAFAPTPVRADSITLQNGTATFSQGSPDLVYDGLFEYPNGWSGATTSETAVWETATDVNADTLTFRMYFTYMGNGYLLGRFRFSVTTDDRNTFADGLDNGGDVTANWIVLGNPTVQGPPGMTFTTLPDNSILANGPYALDGIYTVVYPNTVSNITGIRLEALEDPSLPNLGPGTHPSIDNFMLSELTLNETAPQSPCTPPPSTPPDTGEVTIPLGVNPDEIEVNPVTNRIYVTYNGRGCFSESGLLVIDGNTNTILTDIPLPSLYYYGVYRLIDNLVINPTTNRIYLADGNVTYVINGATNSVEAVIPIAAINPAVNTVTNKIYLHDGTGIQVIDGATNSLVTTIPLYNIGYLGGEANITVNPITNRLYKGGIIGQFNVIDLNTNTSGFIDLDRYDYIAAARISDKTVVNPATNRIYWSVYFDYIEPQFNLAIIDGDTNTVVNLIELPTPFTYPDGLTMLANPSTNFIYALYVSGDFLGINGNTNTVALHRLIPRHAPGAGIGDSTSFALNPTTSKLYFTRLDERDLLVVDLKAAETSTGSGVQATTEAATLTFNNVTSAGTTTVSSISDPSTAGEIPGGFAISEQLAYEINTTATFSGPVTTCFNIASVNDPVVFDSLRVLHREFNTTTGKYELIDRTTSHDFASRTICATTTSFSPFYLARTGNKIQPLFDRSRAFRSGSTIPVKVRLLDSNNQNVSTASTPLSIRGMRLIGSNTTTTVVDSGNANADNNFRYDSSLQGYIFNLSTRGLAAGRYALSFYAGSDHSYFYTVEFEVR